MTRAGADDVLRISGAHESPAEWSALAARFKAQAAEQGKRGRIFVDLPGPKLRAEIRALEDAVMHLPRRKDRLGRTVAPTEVLLVGEHRGGAEVPVPPGRLAQLKPDDTISFTDAAGRKRELTVLWAAAGMAARRFAVGQRRDRTPASPPTPRPTPAPRAPIQARGRRRPSTFE